MKEAGNVTRADVFEDRMGRSQGCGIVEYSTPQEAQAAIEKLTNSDLLGRVIFVREDREEESGEGRRVGRGGFGGGGGSRGGRGAFGGR
eukprot:CAMPEP_0113850342 /NCGR_PEP_ID=MMETSP0372-20130328/3808_1 /TAXON_ID=340204 /ORGANISM="Lankesteria abbotti" /LENGTH=88 /DNA_ID=CAMNT_0000820583 /DNA_START=66 /DNA_END=329 /DNA_ORIENTATION=+ /assembly_acc=CAM_ASM_000359